jgi:hypothetical protein
MSSKVHFGGSEIIQGYNQFFAAAKLYPKKYKTVQNQNL